MTDKSLTDKNSIPRLNIMNQTLHHVKEIVRSLLLLIIIFVLLTLMLLTILLVNSPLWLGAIVGGLISASTNWMGWGYEFGPGKFRIGEKANRTQVASGIASFIYGVFTGAILALLIGMSLGVFWGGLIGGLIGGIVGWGIGIFIARQYNNWLGDVLRFVVPFVIIGLELGQLLLDLGGDETSSLVVAVILIAGMIGLLLGIGRRMSGITANE